MSREALEGVERALREKRIEEYEILRKRIRFNPLTYDCRLDPSTETYDVEFANDALDKVAQTTLDALLETGFGIPCGVNINNLKDAFWELIGNASNDTEIFNIQRDGRIAKETPERVNG